ncbi:MAG TPA: right-handed parallel beta-helix repeat-containing protein, partial [Candidatus Binatia bacterium]
MVKTRRSPRCTVFATVFATALAGAWLLSAAAAHALDFYVDAAAGDDTRGPLEALSPATPWRTIDHALRQVQPGHTIRVRPGTYPESVGTACDAVSLVADEGLGSVFLEPPAGAVGVDVRHRDVVVDGIAVRGGATGLRAELADGLRVLRSAFVAQSGTGVRVVGSASVQIDSVVVASSGKAGIELERSAPSLVRNNLVYDTGTWGIVVEGEAAGAQLDTTLAFNTVAYNGGASGGGIFLREVAVDVRDNVLAFNEPIGLRVGAGAVPHVRHNLIFGSGQLVFPEGSALGPGNVVADPLFTQPAGADGVLGGPDGFLDDDFSLQQLAAGDAAQSPAVDAGSVAAAEDIGGSTRRDAELDAGVADLGFHRGARLADAIPDALPVPAPAPGSGATYWVDCAAGDDTRSKAEAVSPATPWRTIGRAARMLAYGEVAMVKPGACAEEIETRTAGVTFAAATPGSVVVEPPAGKNGFNVQHDDVTIDGFVVRSPHQGVLGAK